MFKYRKDIDGLRAISVLAVVIFHAFPNSLRNGFLGVDIFFVISGYLISSITLQEFKENRFSVINFYLKRIKRIFPPALIVLLFSTVVALLTLHYSEFLRFKNSLAAASLYYINYQLEAESGYFDVGILFKPLMHFWSLAVEEQFYILWPLGLLAARRLKYKKILLKVLPIVFVASLSWFFYTSNFYYGIFEGSFYYSLEVRAWELLAGVGVTFLSQSELSQKHLARLNQNLFLNLANAGSIALIVGFIFPEIVWSNLIAVAGAACIILNGRANLITNFLSSKLMVGIGLMSYSLYLWHWPFLSFLRIYKADVGTGPVLLAIAISFVFAFFTYYAVERPLKRQTWNFRFNGSPKNKSHGLYRAAALLLCSISLFFGSFYLKPFFSGEPESYNEAVVIPLSGTCLLSEINKNYDLKKIAFCYSNKTDSLQRGLIVGDSHANAIFSGIVHSFDDIKWDIVAHHSCMPIIGNDQRNPEDRVCGDMLADAIRYATKEKFRFIVFATANRAFEVLVKLHGSARIKDIFKKEFAGFTGLPGGPIVVIMNPVPEFKIWPQQCMGNRVGFVQQFIPEGPSACIKSRTAWFEESATLRKMYLELKSTYPELIVYDPTDIICGKADCNLGSSKYFYMDQDHLSQYGSLVVINALKDQLNKMGTAF